MYVLHVDTERGWRGGQRQVLLLAQGLRELGVRQTLAAPPGSPLLRAAEREGLPVAPLRQRAEIDPLAVLALRRLLPPHGPAVVHAHAGHAHALAALAFPGRWDRPLRLVVSRRVDNALRRSAASRWKWSHGADRILCVSGAVRDVLLGGGLAPERLMVVYSAVPELPRLPPARPGAASGAAVRLVSVGSIVAHKGHEVLLRAMPLVRSAQVELCVYGDGPLRPALQRLAAELGLAGRVRFAGFVPDARERLKEHDVFVQPSVGEGLGTSILDAMLAGLPVAAAAAGGIPELVEDGRTGRLALAGSPVALAAALDRLLEEPELTRDCVAAARALVLERHGVQRLAAETLGQYVAALEALPAPAPALTAYRVQPLSGGLVLRRHPAPRPARPEGAVEQAAGPALEPGRLGWSGPDALPGAPVPAGRGRLRRVLWHGVPAWLKWYRRGGILGPLRSGYRRPLPRLVRGLLAEEQARSAGLAVPRTLALGIRRGAGGNFEVLAISEALVGWSDLDAVLAAGGPAEGVLRELGRTLRRLHDAGVVHGDLNLKNVLVAPHGALGLVDFDPALVLPRVGARLRRRGLARVRRSLLKRLGRAEPSFSLVLEGYGQPEIWGLPQRLASGLWHAAHALLWSRS
jgi:glycosyltransferase involved in cell wall biosynthesis